MVRYKLSFLYRSIIIAGALLCVFVLGASLVVPSRETKPSNQVSECTISRNHASKEPFDVFGYRVGGTAISEDVSFAYRDDWLKGFEFMIRNKSNKPIVYISIEMDFPETKITGPIMTYQTQMGQQSGSPHAQNYRPILLIPNDVAVFSLSEEQYARVKAFLKAGKYSLDVHKVILRIHTVIFSDGIMWSVGNLYRPDNTSPSKWRKIEQ